VKVFELVELLRDKNPDAEVGIEIVTGHEIEIVNIDKVEWLVPSLVHPVALIAVDRLTFANPIWQ
jgi:hypothetical protein